jgi:CBS domain-containing protein
LDQPVYSPEGEKLGRLYELGCAAGEPFPRVLTYYIRPTIFSSVVLAAPAPALRTLPAPELVLTRSEEELKPSRRRLPQEILLRKEILDKQIVDTDGARVVRVNDIHLLRAGSEVRVVHVDIGTSGILRRLGWEKLLARFFRGNGSLAPRLLSWRYVVPLRSGSLTQDLRLSVTQSQLAQLHPAELAEILEELDRFEGPAVLEALDVPRAAQALAELSPPVQRLLLQALDIRRAAALLSALPPDEAADLLEELPQDLRERLMAHMPAGEAAQVEQLLAQEPDTAGSLMNPETFSVPSGTRVGDILRRLRQGPEELARTYAVMVVEGERLRGMVEMTSLLRAREDQQVEEIMDMDPVAVRPGDPMSDVAELFDRFNLLALPVVEEERRLVGVITVDDVVAWLRQGQEREGRLT